MVLLSQALVQKCITTIDFFPFLLHFVVGGLWPIFSERVNDIHLTAMSFFQLSPHISFLHFDYFLPMPQKIILELENLHKAIAFAEHRLE